jgi:hypothetical protein
LLIFFLHEIMVSIRRCYILKKLQFHADISSSCCWSLFFIYKVVLLAENVSFIALPFSVFLIKNVAYFLFPLWLQDIAVRTQFFCLPMSYDWIFLSSSDISILEQLKRQRRHSRRKARRASDSENSETENGEATASERRENVRFHNETLLSETGSETDLTSSLSESGGETSDDQGESLDGGVQRPPKKHQPVPSSKKGHKRRGKKSARKSASSAKHQHHEDVFV